MMQGLDGRGTRTILSGYLAAMLLGIGCTTSDLPKTYPAHGRVVFKEKNTKVAVLSGCYVEFQSLADPAVRALGEIRDDGSFMLGCFHKDKGMEGVLPGKYRARIALPPGDDGATVRPFLHRGFESFEKSGLQYDVTEGDNDFTVTVGKSTR